MSDEIREQLSALVDDELDELERPLLLGRLQRDTDMRECLGRYQLIGEVMRGAGHTATLGVAGRVQQALENDGALHGGGAAGLPASRWWKPLAGLAVAASVALVAVFSISNVNRSEPVQPQLAAVPQPVAPAQPAVTTVRADDDQQWNRIQPQVDKRLSGYLVNHSEFAASRGVQGVMPYVRIVGFENGEQ